MKPAVIKEAPLSALPALHRVFTSAVDEHFTYFAHPVRIKVKQDHSLARLVLARMDYKRVLLVARVGGQLVGYAIGAAPKTGPAQLYWLYVEPEYRRSGVGRQLLASMVKALVTRGAKVISLATYDHRDFYTRQGFKFIKRTVIDGVTMDVLTYEAKV